MGQVYLCQEDGPKQRCVTYKRIKNMVTYAMTAFIASEIPGLAGKVLNPGCNSVGYNTCLHLCTYKQSLIHTYIHIAIIIKYKV